MEGIPFVPENFWSIRAFHLQLNRLIRKCDKRTFNFAIQLRLIFKKSLKVSKFLSKLEKQCVKALQVNVISLAEGTKRS